MLYLEHQIFDVQAFNPLILAHCQPVPEVQFSIHPQKVFLIFLQLYHLLERNLVMEKNWDF